MKLLLVLLLALAANAQELTPADDLVNVLDVYHSEDWLSWAEKMPIDASLELDQIPLPAAPVAVHSVAWQAPVPQAGCSGVCVSFSGQGAAALKALTGKRISGFQLVEATTCADHDARFGGGLIIQQANSMGIQTLGSKVGAAVVQQTVDTGWRKWAMIIAEVAVGGGMALTVPGTIAASKAWQTGLVYGHIALDQLPRFLSPGAPNPDPFLTSVLDENAQISIPAGACVSAMFAGTWDKNAVKVTGKVQLLP